MSTFAHKLDTNPTSLPCVKSYPGNSSQLPFNTKPFSLSSAAHGSPEVALNGLKISAGPTASVAAGIERSRTVRRLRLGGDSVAETDQGNRIRADLLLSSPATSSAASRAAASGFRARKAGSRHRLAEAPTRHR